MRKSNYIYIFIKHFFFHIIQNQSLIMIKYQSRVLLWIIDLIPEWKIVHGARAAKAVPQLPLGKFFSQFQLHSDFNFNVFFSLKRRCHQLLVNYTKIPWHEWEKAPPDLEKVEWDVANTRLLINSEGCGYPPHVNCTEFAKKFGWVVISDWAPSSVEIRNNYLKIKNINQCLIFIKNIPHF